MKWWMWVVAYVGAAGVFIWLLWRKPKTKELTCRCAELNVKGEFLAAGVHHSRCPLYERYELIAPYKPEVPKVILEDLNDPKLYLYDREGSEDMLWTSAFNCIGCGKGVLIDPEINDGWMVPRCECRGGP